MARSSDELDHTHKEKEAPHARHLSAHVNELHTITPAMLFPKAHLEDPLDLTPDIFHPADHRKSADDAEPNHPQLIANHALKDGEHDTPLWRQYPDEKNISDHLGHGTEGCAASVSMVLKEAGYHMNKLENPAVGGYNPIEHKWTEGLATNLKDNLHWKQLNNISAAKPGDVIYGNNGGDDQHIGVVVEKGGHLYCADNDSDTVPPHMILEHLNSCYIVEHFGSNAHLLAPQSDSNKPK